MTAMIALYQYWVCRICSSPWTTLVANAYIVVSHRTEYFKGKGLNFAIKQAWECLHAF